MNVKAEKSELLEEFTELLELEVLCELEEL